MAAIDVVDLTKDYGEVLGVDALSFTVEKGEVSDDAQCIVPDGITIAEGNDDDSILLTRP